MRSEQSASRVTQTLVSCAAALCVTCTAQAEETIELSIPPQSLETALLAFSDQSGAQVVTSSDSVADIRTKGVSGAFTPRVALARLIEGTGLEIRLEGEHSFSLAARAAPAQPTEAPRQDTASSSSADAKKKVQTRDATGPIEDGKGWVETVIVTAQKRQERLIDVPQSVSVLSADHLNKLGALQFRDFANTVPGLSFATQGAGFTQVTLRGVTAGVDLGPTVGIYVDDVPYGSSSSLTFGGRLPLDVGLFDLDRIEVLRGPQGTLYGASSMGGLIKYVTKGADASRFGVDARAGFSSTRDGGESYDTAATLNAPIITDRVALRATGFYSRDGGFVDNLALNQKDVDQSDVKGGRLDLLVTPTDALSVRLTGFLQDISRDGKAIVDLRNLGGTPVDGPFDQRRPRAEPYDQSFKLFSGTLTYDFRRAALTSVSAYQTSETDFASDISAYFLSAFPSISSWGLLNHQTTKRFTQEVRLTSNNSRPLEWVIGGFYSDEDTDLHQEYALRDLAGQTAPNPFYNASSPTTVEERAVFGDLTWYLTDKFDVTAGMRYAENRGTFETFGTGSSVVPRPLTRSSENVSTYLANARYHFSDSVIGYLRYATGYRPGGPNFILRDPATGQVVGPDTFEADDLSSYEVGFKAETDDRRFGIDLAAYYIDWSNIQIISTLGTGAFRAAFRTNAPGGATVRGGELSLTAHPARSFTVAGNFAYTNAQLSEANTSLGGRKGDRLPNVPRFTAALNADYGVEFDGWQPTVGVTLRHVSDRMSAFGNTAYSLPEYTSVDLRAGFVLSSYNMQLYVHNLFDKRGQTSPTLTATGISGVRSVSILQPRTIGIGVTTSF